MNNPQKIQWNKTHTPGIQSMNLPGMRGNNIGYKGIGSGVSKISFG